MHEPKFEDPKLQRVVTAAAAAGVEIYPLVFDKETRTAPEAARAIGCDVGQIVKSLVIEIDGEPVVFLIGGRDRLDMNKAKEATGADSIKRCDADKARTATGFSIGATPPFGHERALRVLLDDGLLEHEVVWAAAGRTDGVFAIAPDDMRRASGAEVADIAE